jgi:hypothetical protein
MVSGIFSAGIFGDDEHKRRRANAEFSVVLDIRRDDVLLVQVSPVSALQVPKSYRIPFDLDLGVAAGHFRIFEFNVRVSAPYHYHGLRDLKNRPLVRPLQHGKGNAFSIGHLQEVGVWNAVARRRGVYPLEFLGGRRWLWRNAGLFRRNYGLARRALELDSRLSLKVLVLDPVAL